MIGGMGATRTATASHPLECECGNSAAREGFYQCDADGRQLRIGASERLQCCRRCGKISEMKTGKYFGQRSFALPNSFDT